MLTLFRGGPVLWLSREDAAALEIADDDWVEAYNRNGIVACRAVVSHRLPEGTCMLYHAKDRHLNTPRTELRGNRGGTENSLTRITLKPTHLIGGYAHLSWGFNYYGPTGSNRDELTIVRKRMQRGRVLMHVKAQLGMVMNLDKCIGCHTCSVTCKQVWTNRPGTEYVWFNNVETKPGAGYPRQWADQERWNGGWTLDRRGRLRLKAGGQVKKLLSIFANPDMPQIDDYYEPFTYDYRTLIDAPLSDVDPVATPRSQLTGEPIAPISGGRTGTTASPAPTPRPTRSSPACRSRCR